MVIVEMWIGRAELLKQSRKSILPLKTLPNLPMSILNTTTAMAPFLIVPNWHVISLTSLSQQHFGPLWEHLAYSAIFSPVLTILQCVRPSMGGIVSSLSLIPLEDLVRSRDHQLLTWLEPPSASLQFGHVWPTCHIHCRKQSARTNSTHLSRLWISLNVFFNHSLFFSTSFSPHITTAERTNKHWNQLHNEILNTSVANIFKSEGSNISYCL